MNLAAKIRERARRREIAELATDLASFFREALTVIEPNTAWVWSPLYDLLCEWLMLISSGEFKQRFPDKLGLVINVPFRTAKSNLITIVWPVFAWITDPSKRFMCASYSDRLATDHSIKRRMLILSQTFQEKFGSRFSLVSDTNRVDHYANDRAGYCVATSVGGSVTGVGADVLIADDLLSQDDSYSDAVRQATNRWIDSTWETRLNNPATGVFVYISQRLAEDDPPGHVLDQHKGKFIHLVAALEAEEDVSYAFPISGRTWHRKKGDVLMRERFTPAVVENLKQQSSVWSGQCQQRPQPPGGGILKRAWWRYYVRPGDPVPQDCVVLPEKFDEMAQSWDMTFKDKRTSDFVCGGVWGRVGATKYLMTDLVWDRLDFPATKKAVKALSERWPLAHAKWIEDKANGSAIIDELKTEISGLIPVQATESKLARLHAAAPDCEAGNVVLPHSSICTWIRRFVDECAGAGCGGKFDDAADMLSQAINKLRHSGFHHGLLDFWKLEAEKMKNKSIVSDPGQRAVDLATMQIESMQNQGGVGSGAFGALRSKTMTTNHVKDSTGRAHLPSVCPQCGKPLSIYGSSARCNSCGWHSDPEAPPKPEIKPLPASSTAVSFAARFL
ncbi:MAG: phage terminase large subunit, partial [Candidatus Sulfotelmatobacter sp.]